MNILKKLAIVTTHPIQYNSPLFAMISGTGIATVKVFYTWGASVLDNKYDPGFGKIIEWDIPLLEGFDYTFVVNISSEPGSHHFKGIVNPTLTSEIESWNADAILVFGWSFHSHLKCLRYFHKKMPVWFRGDSTLLDDDRRNSFRKPIRRFFLKWIYRHVDKALYVGRNNKLYFLSNGLKEDQLIFAPHAIDNSRFESAGFSNRRNELSLPADAVVFLFTGKFETKKNPILLLNAFLELCLNNTYLLLVGNGKLEPDMKATVAASRSQSAKRIRFLDFQNQQAMPEIYRSADVFILPSQGPGETWGLSVNEAMACGLPVIVSEKCGCSADLVTDGENGYVFKHDDIQSLKTAMHQIVLNKKKMRGMGMRSSQIIQRYSFQNVAEAIAQLIRDIPVKRLPYK